MPNGGSDCCGTCWFNAANRGRSGHGKAEPGVEAACEIRRFRIEAPFYTYCANHPKRMPERGTIPLGPVWVDEGRGRVVFRPSPDTPEIRAHLLRRLALVGRSDRSEYPIGLPLDVVVIRQAAEFAEAAAVPDLERISASTGPIAAEAREAIERIRASVRPV